MHNYNIIATTEQEKYKIIEVIRNVGATLTAVSGYGSGFYIQLSADSTQADQINNKLMEG